MVAEMVLVINNAGLPMLTKVFDFTSGKDEDAVKPVLIAGFLSAIQAFSNEIANTTGEILSVSLEGRHLLIQKYDDFSIAAIMNNDNTYIREAIIELGDMVKSSYTNLNETVSIDEGMQQLFDHIATLIFSDRYLKDNWIVKLRDEITVEGIQENETVKNLIQIHGREIKAILLRLQKEGKITFTRSLNPTSLLSPTINAKRFLVSTNPTCSIQGSLGTIPPCKRQGTQSCKNILQRVTETGSVEKLVGEIEGTEEDILDFINCLLDKELIVELTPHIKQVHKIKQIANCVLEVVNNVMKHKDVEEIVNKSMANLEEVGFSSEIIQVNGQYSANMSLNPYTELGNEGINRVISSWIAFIKDIVKDLPAKRLRRVTEELMTEHTDKFVNFYENTYDPRQEEFDMFLTFLETSV